MAKTTDKAKADTTNKKGKGKKKADKKKQPSQKHTQEDIPTANKPKEKPVQDTTHKLPQQHAEQRIVCNEVGATTPTNISLSEIGATSKAMYVDDIHHANPTILQTIYWVHLKDHRLVMARITEEEYEKIYQADPKKRNHHISVVDCAVTPTLSYGAWPRHELKNDFPSPEQIAKKDEEFRQNETNFHNPPTKINVTDIEEDSEEDWDWDTDGEDEEDLFDFAEES